MARGRSVVINGDLGSGKSTVSTLLAEQLGVRRISIGDLYRDMAKHRGMTALELNLHAELDDKVDYYVDQLQSDIAMSARRSSWTADWRGFLRPGAQVASDRRPGGGGTPGAGPSCGQG